MDTLRSVTRALGLLQTVAQMAEGNRPLTLVSISTEAGLHPSTAHRLLRALHESGLVYQPPDSREFRLGPRLMWLGKLAGQHMALPRVALPIMQRVAATMGETVTLNVLQEGQRICVQAVEGSSMLRSVAEAGRSYPLNAGPTARVLLAFSPKAERDPIIQALPPDQLPDPEGFRASLAQVVRQGYSFGHNDRIIGLSAMSRPVFGTGGQFVAAMSVSGPNTRFHEGALPGLHKALLGAALELSTMQGFTGDYVSHLTRLADEEV